MRYLLTVAAILWAMLLTCPANAQEPLHQQIDMHIAAKADGALNPAASDAEFVRRIYLDLAGRIPTRDETQRFLADTSPDKRVKLIDELLVSPQYAAHMASVFHVMLTERLGEHADWQAWLTESFAANKPWDQMCREMLAPHSDEADPARGAGFFLSKRLENYGQNPVDHPALVRDVGRLLLGVDLQCAQCHDHPQIDDYKQIDYQGLYAYFANVSLRSGVKFPAVQEKLAQKVEFQSVFVSGKHEVALRLPFGMETAIPAFEKGQEFVTLPDRKTNHPGVLKFSSLQTLSSDLPQPTTPGFSKNIVNRLWWHMQGRGLVHPLDLHHSANKPSHPELLETLSNEFAARQYDIQWLLREIALSDTYQRSSVLPADSRDIALTSYRVAIEKGLSPEQMARSLWTATGPWTDDKLLTDLQTRCVKALAQPPREPETDFAPGVKGALFLSHDSLLLSLLEPQAGNLIDRLQKLDTAEAAAKELYLAVYSREPSDDERQAFVERWHATEERDRLLKDYLWAMLSSNEFAINH